MTKSRLFLTAFAVGGLFTASGCETDDEAADARGQFDVIWQVDGLGANGDGCAEIPGAHTVELVSQPVSGGTTYEDLFDCEAGRGVTATLPLGDYDLWVNLRDSDGRLLADSQTVAASVDFDGHLRVVEQELSFRNAQFEASWALTEEFTDDPLTCDEVGAGGVSLLSTLAGPGGTGFDDIFDCPASDTAGDVETDPLPLGDYTVSVALLEFDTDDVLGEVAKDGSLASHATVEDLGVFEFTFAPEGTGAFDVIWKIDGLDADGDGCDTLPGVAGVEVVSERVSDGTVVIDIFDCGDGGAVTSELPLGDYDVWMNVIDGDDRLLASSQEQQVLLDQTDPAVQVPDEFVFFNAQFEATWLLTEEGTEDPLTCDEVGVHGVSFVSTLASDSGTAFDDIFDCPANDDEGDVETGPLALGEWTVSVSVLDIDDEVLGTAPPKDGELVEHATLVDLGIFEFLFD